MSGGFVDKFRDFMGLDDEVDYEVEDMETSEDYREYEDIADDNNFIPEQPKTKRVNNNLVSLHTNGNMKIVVHEPLKYEEAPAIINDLKVRKTVVVNLEQLDPEIKRRIFDFINGGLYSLEGNIQKVTKDIFVLAPDNVEIDGLKDELKNKGIFSW